MHKFINEFLQSAIFKIDEDWKGAKRLTTRDPTSEKLGEGLQGEATNFRKLKERPTAHKGSKGVKEWLPLL